MYCVRCGRPGNPRRKTCAHCGTRLIDPDTLKPYHPIPKTDSEKKPVPDAAKDRKKTPDMSRRVVPLAENPLQPGRSVFVLSPDDSLYEKQEPKKTVRGNGGRPGEKKKPVLAEARKTSAHKKKPAQGKKTTLHTNEKDALRTISDFTEKWTKKAKQLAKSTGKTVSETAEKAGKQSKEWTLQAGSALKELTTRAKDGLASASRKKKAKKTDNRRRTDKLGRAAEGTKKKREELIEIRNPEKQSAGKKTGSSGNVKAKKRSISVNGSAPKTEKTDFKRRDTSEIRLPSFMEESEKRQKNAKKSKSSVKTVAESTGTPKRAKEIAVPLKNGKQNHKANPKGERDSGKKTAQNRSANGKNPGRHPQNRAFGTQDPESFVEKHLRSMIAMTLLTVSLAVILLWCVNSTPGKRIFAQLGIGGSEGYILLGDDCMEDGNYARAVEYYYKAIAKKTDYAAAYRLACAYRATNDAEREISALLLCVDKFGNEKDPYYRLKELYPFASSRPSVIQDALNKGADEFGDQQLKE